MGKSESHGFINDEAAENLQKIRPFMDVPDILDKNTK